MKRCPTCDKTFDDNLKFCQIDGTALIDENPEPVDPFKTMMASKEEIAAAMSSLNEPAADSEEPVLDLPSSFDSGKTQVVSESELREEMAKADLDNDQVIDVPPAASGFSVPEPEPPKFSEPEVHAPDFSSPPPDKFSQSSPAIPSPFGDQVQEASSPSDQESPAPYIEPEPLSPFSASTPEPELSDSPSMTVEPEPAYNPFEHSAPQASEPLAQAEWTPPAANESSMQNPQNFGQNPSAAAAGPNQTLAIISLVVGILSIFCCGWFIPGIAAIVMGFMARGKANSDPSNYGGAGLALGGIITGALSLVLGVIVVILYVFLGVGANLMQGM